MKFKIALTLLVIGCQISCNIYSQKKTIDTITFNSTFVKNIDNVTCAYKCNDFVVNAFSKGYELKKLVKNTKKDFNISKEPMQNMHDALVMDTIYHFSNKKNNISVYKAVHAEFVNLFDVTDKRFVLYGNIRTGMSKVDFKKKFRIKDLKEDNIVITDEDNMMKFYFSFNKKNLLSKISFKAFID